jgi:flagellar hook assembly protein FlgD
VIGYQLPSASIVKIVIYNVISQEVRTLVDSFEPSGYLKAKWDGRDNRGYGVAPGVYFYKLTAGNFFDIKKMVYVK